MLAQSVLLSCVWCSSGLNNQASLQQIILKIRGLYFDGWASRNFILHDSVQGPFNQLDWQSLWKWVCGWEAVVQKIAFRLCFNLPAALHYVCADSSDQLDLELMVDQEAISYGVAVHSFSANIRRSPTNNDIQTTSQPLQRWRHGINNLHHERLNTEAWAYTGINAE